MPKNYCESRAHNRVRACLPFPQVAGTEDGIKEPQATFSACFGAAFIMLHPTKYAAMLAEKMQKYGATGWLVNTGWSGGRYVPPRLMKLPRRHSLLHCKTLVRYATERVYCLRAWLIRYGIGKRIKLPYTRKIIDAIHSGELLAANYKKTEVFGLEIPTEINGVPLEILDPINTVSSIIACNLFLKIFRTTR
jgi:phosphoenolpyruvate carboxykinase (ATP)